MKRFIKEYASYIKERRRQFLKGYKESGGADIDYYKEVTEFENRIDRLLNLRERGMISTDETMAELTKMACPWLVR